MGKFALAGAIGGPLSRDLERPPPSPHPPRRTSNESKRQRVYLTPDELERLLKAAGNAGRHGHGDRTLILLAYRHGFRESELVALRWEQIELKTGLMPQAEYSDGGNDGKIGMPRQEIIVFQVLIRTGDN